MRQPRSPHPGRKPSTQTPLGKLLVWGNWSVTELSGGTEIHARTLNEYLSGREVPSSEHQRRIAEWLEVPAARLWP